MPINYLQLATLIISILALTTAVLALIFINSLNKLRKSFFVGKGVASLEEFIVHQNKKINELDSQAQYIEQALLNMQEVQKFSIQKIGLKRYNPFADDGGNLSFSMALLDAHDNGVVITSMHSREQNRVYSKPIKKGGSDFPLTEEERQTIISSKNF